MTNFLWTRKPDFTQIKKFTYDDYWMQRGFRFNDRLKEREVIIFNLIKPEDKVLDVGCGNSRLGLSLKEKGCNVSVADISKIVLNEFEKVGIGTYFIDLVKLDFNSILDAKWDAIILSEVLEHTPNPEDIIKELKKITDTIIITIPNSAFYKFRFHLLLSGRFFTQWISHPSEHLRYWSHTDFIDWLNAIGLKVIKHKSSNGIKILKDLWPNIFGFQIVYVCSTKE